MGGRSGAGRRPGAGTKRRAGRRPGRPAALFAGAILAAALVHPVALTAQTVRGQVVDADYGRPLPGATVLLLDSTSVPVDSAATDDVGRFVLTAPAPGRFLVHVRIRGYLSYSGEVEVGAAEVPETRIEMPLVSESAAAVMRDVIDREAAFQLPWEELCGEPVRPWEAGVLVGVARDRATMNPIRGAVVRVEPLGDDDRSRAGEARDTGGAAVAVPQGGEPETGAWPRSRVATATGSFWFCNVPPGRVRVVARADGFAADTSHATIRAGTISWYDALLRPR